MVVVTSIQIDPSTAEEFDEMVQNVPTESSLDYCEDRLHLPTEGHVRALDDGGAEAPFTVDEPNDPSNVPESFLLVFRRDALYVTRHRIVTVHIRSLPTGCDRNGRVPDGCTGFSSI